jgi:asparagine synthase (glutamine-hydrolysing)
MCGICGLAATQLGQIRGVIDSQLADLDHRGPDARGSFSGRHGVIGQDRLSIIDLVIGDPPITNEDGAVAAVLNGEI